MSFQRKGFVSLVVSQQLGKKNINFKIKSKRIKTRHLNTPLIDAVQSTDLRYARLELRRYRCSEYPNPRAAVDARISR